VDIFDQPGSSDLTANVDFTYLSESLDTTGSKSHGPIPQSQFLLALGLEPRMAKLLASAEGKRKEDIRKGATRLIDTLGMGSQYQVMGIETDSDGEVYPFLPSPAPTPTPTAAPAAATPAGSGESTAS
jgi:NADH dehydrogenase [ubiquinone] 1 alpha subcomplex assembly factor 7